MPNDNDSKRYVTRKDAFELFGEMRSSTPEEQEAMRRCYDKHAVTISEISIFDGLEKDSERQSVDLGMNIFDLPDDVPSAENTQA